MVNSNTCRNWNHTLGEHEIRCCLLTRFPYAVIYVVFRNEVVMAATAHMHR